MKQFDLNNDKWYGYERGDATMDECENGEWVRADEAKKRIADLERQKDGAYSERNKLVAAISRLYPSAIGRHEESDDSWDRDWMNIIFISTPHGQLSCTSMIPSFRCSRISWPQRTVGMATRQKRSTSVWRRFPAMTSRKNWTARNDT